MPAKEKVVLSSLSHSHSKSIQMELTVNNKRVQRDTPCTLNQLLKDMDVKSMKGVAVAVNQRVVQKADLERTALKDQDSILIIKATQGG